MFILIKDNNTISTYNLDSEIKYKGIHIYSKNDNYYISLDKGLYFEDNSKTKQLSITSYVVYEANVYYQINIYVYENDDGINDYELYKTGNFLVYNDSSTNIITRDPYLKNYYLGFKEGYLQTNFDIRVNGNKYDSSKLKPGDLIEYLGLRIYYFDEFLYINNFNVEVKLKKHQCENAVIKYQNTKKIDNFYISDDIYELDIKDLDKYKLPNKQDSKELIKNLIPNFIMCICMWLMAYTNYINNKSSNNILTYILMPISMLLTGILVPIIFIIVSDISYKKECLKIKNDYLSYLDSYIGELKDSIEKYVNSLNSRYFDLFNSKNRMFYASIKSSDFLKLSVGKIVINKNLVLDKTNDSEIDEKLHEIESLSNNIDNCPLYLDLLHSKTNTIVSKKIDKKYLFNKFLLETSYKHHYDDVGIAIYSKDINTFNNVYNLPHLFIHGIRLTLTSFEDLQMLDQMHFNKPLILFMYDYSEFHFTNENIHIIYFSTDIVNILKNSDTVIEYLNNSGYVYKDNKREFKYYMQDINFNNYYKSLGRLKSINEDSSKYSFIDVYGNDVDHYYLNNDYSLKAIFSYNNSELISFDLHESKQGPHGLIGGSTGSGKSELIVSLLLSMCIRYSPEYLNIVLIDYKGGGIKESLSHNGQAIPHIVASISNLQNNSLDRMIIALHNECKYRQSLFKELSNKSNVSIMNIDDYLHANVDSPKLSHLLIVVDEFAELKKENPEQIKELISISRIGRSLGIHLILATQKPAGVIDDEIWSNSRFKIALKVFDEKDSTDIIKNKDAAYLDKPGSFYLLVDGSTIKGQSMYTKADCEGKDPYQVSTLNNILQIDKTYKKQVNTINSIAGYYCEKIIDATNRLNLKPRNIEYMPPIEKDRHSLVKGPCIVFGEKDDYINNSKGLLAYGLNESVLVYSSRKNEINAILNTLNEYKRNTVVIANKEYQGFYISDSITYDNSEDINYLFKKLLNTKHNNLTLVIEDLYCLLSYDEEYIDVLKIKQI